MAMRIFTDVVNVKAVMRMLDQPDADTVSGEMRNDLLNQRRFAATRPSSESKYPFRHDVAITDS